jgi:hypothetical protein
MPRAIGNFDNDPGGTSTDIAYVLFSSTDAYGKVVVRLNLKDPSGAFGYGTFPWEAPVLTDPLAPVGTLFGFAAAVPVGDVNGDGLPDLLVGTDGSGYALILY